MSWVIDTDYANNRQPQTTHQPAWLMVVCCFESQPLSTKRGTILVLDAQSTWPVLSCIEQIVRVMFQPNTASVR